jgi:hypothetical protein
MVRAITSNYVLFYGEAITSSNRSTEHQWNEAGWEKTSELKQQCNKAPNSATP